MIRTCTKTHTARSHRHYRVTHDLLAFLYCLKRCLAPWDFKHPIPANSPLNNHGEEATGIIKSLRIIHSTFFQQRIPVCQSFGELRSCWKMTNPSSSNDNAGMAKDAVDVQGDLMTPFPFTSLPPEIRNKVYRLTCTQTDPIEVQWHQFKNPCRRSGCCDWAVCSLCALTQPPLTRVCRSIRSEALPIYYGENRFLQSYPDSPGTPLFASPLLEWLQFIGEANCKLLRYAHNCGYSLSEIDVSTLYSHNRVPYFAHLLEELRNLENLPQSAIELLCEPVCEKCVNDKRSLYKIWAFKEVMRTLKEIKAAKIEGWED